MSLIRCPECEKEISDQAKSCPNCGYPLERQGTPQPQPQQSPVRPPVQQPVRSASRTAGCLLAILTSMVMFGLMIVVMYNWGKSMSKDSAAAGSAAEATMSEEESLTNAEPIVNMEEFSRISLTNLIQMMGEPSSTESWTHKTSHGDFEFVTYLYDKDNIHYEFIVTEDSVVRLTLYSQQYWTNEGERFSFSTVEDIFSNFGISKGKDIKKVTDNTFTLVYSPVSDQVAKVHIYDIDSDEKTFGLIKVTYNLNYFD